MYTLCVWGASNSLVVFTFKCKIYRPLVPHKYMYMYMCMFYVHENRESKAEAGQYVQIKPGSALKKNTRCALDCTTCAYRGR